MKKLSVLFFLLVISGMTLACKDVNNSKPDKVKTGKAVKGIDDQLTVTPRSDGLLIQLNAQEEWKHISFCVRDVTNKDADEWHEKIEVEVPVTTTSNSVKGELLFPFTEKNRNYEVWITHSGNNEDEFADWADEEGKAASVKAIGGIGQYDVTCNKAQYWSPKRGLYLEHFSKEIPTVITADQQMFRVRAEIGDRWTNPDKYYETSTISDTIWFPTDTKNEFTKSLIGQNQIFLTVQFVLTYKGIEYTQRFFGNWGEWDDTLDKEVGNWFVDYEALDSTANKLPVVKITSTENDQSNDFVATPITGHVKTSQQSWGDYSNADVPDPYYEQCKITVEDENGTSVLSNIVAQVKVRGNWTTSYDKKSLRIKYDKKQTMLGLNNNEKFKNWVLLAGFKDASLLRDAAAFKMYETMFPDYYVSDSKLVEVFVNDVYWGVYLLAEQQETKSERININEAEKNYEGTDIGYLIEFDSYYQTEAENEQFEIDYKVPIKDYNGKTMQDPQKGYTIKSDVYSAAQKDFIKNYMNNLWEICYEAAYNNTYKRFTDKYELEQYTPEGPINDYETKCRNCISQVIDIKSLADMYIFSELICDPDLYLTSFFMDIDFSEDGDKKLRFEAPWDFDSTMGNKNFCSVTTSNGNITGINDMFAGALQTDVNCYDDKVHGNPWMLIFIKCGWFQDLVKSEWATAKTKNALQAANTLISSYKSYEERLELNRARWENPADVISEIYGPARDAAYESHEASVNYFKLWLQTRYNAMDGIIKGLK